MAGFQYILRVRPTEVAGGLDVGCKLKRTEEDPTYLARRRMEPPLRWG